MQSMPGFNPDNLQTRLQVIPMITKDELLSLLGETETYRVEKTVSTTNMDKFCEAICAFANDMPNSKQNGYLLIGVTDDGKRSGLKVTDDLLKKITSIRMDGNILPQPVMSVESFPFPDGDVLVVEVSPSELPPVRYRGRTFIRIGPRKDWTTREEEDILAERRCYSFPTMDNSPCTGATLDDIDVEQFEQKYMLRAIAPAYEIPKYPIIFTQPNRASHYSNRILYLNMESSSIRTNFVFWSTHESLPPPQQYDSNMASSVKCMAT